MKSCGFFNIFVPLISQTTKCKIQISNFDYDRLIKNKTSDIVITTLNNNVRQFENVNVNVNVKFNLKFIFKISDMMASDWVMTWQRFQYVKYGPVMTVDNLVSILSLQEKMFFSFDILSIFQPITWCLLIISWLIYSLINVKSRRSFVFYLTTSIIDHFECLLNKKCKLIQLTVNLTFDFFKKFQYH